MRRLACSLAASITWFAASGAAFQGPDPSSPANPPLFADSSLLEITVTTALKEVLKDRGEERDDHPGTLSFRDAQGQEHTLEIGLRTRGHFRLMPRNCSFPPLRVNLKKKEVQATLFDGQDKLKLVTHCRDNKQYEQYVLQEYLVYRVYNLLTPKSFGVRLVRVTYLDAEKPDEPTVKFGFFIEDVAALAARNEMHEVELDGFHPLGADPMEMGTLDVFQYLIANTDWSVPGGHNTVLIQDHETGMVTAVPYDFDHAGVVNARYAKPSEKLPIRSVRERLYRGFCRPAEDLELVFQRMRDKKPAIYTLYERQEGLDTKAREQALKFYDEFYETINNERRARRDVIEACRGG